MKKSKYIKKEDLEEGDIIWNDKTDFGDGEESRHPNLVTNEDIYAMSSSKDRGDNSRIEYNKYDVLGQPPLGMNYSGKYVTNITQKLTEKEYQYYNTMKRSFIIKFKNWLNTGKFE